MIDNERFIPYGRQQIENDDIQAVIDVLKSDFLTTGSKVQEFENSFAEYVGSRYAISVSNGTAALHLAVKVLGIEKGMEGITSVNTFLASANCIIYNDLNPVFGDIKPETYNISLDEIKNRTTEKTKLIIPVHFAGQPCEMEKIIIFAKENNLFVIEDASHAVGSKYENGKKIGCCCYSDLTTFSFHPVKTMTTGEGGMITTNNKEIFEKLLSLRNHGMVKNSFKNDRSYYSTDNIENQWYYEMQSLGYNYRLTDIQSALGSSQLKKVDSFIKRRREIVDKYNEAFKKIDWLIPPFEKKDIYSAFHLYILKIDFKGLKKTRNEVILELKSKSIGTQVHYIPLNLQPYYQQNYNYTSEEYPIALNYYRHALSLPLYPSMSDKEVDKVISSLLELKK